MCRGLPRGIQGFGVASGDAGRNLDQAGGGRNPNFELFLGVSRFSSLNTCTCFT